jgi:hypothetical protein
LQRMNERLLRFRQKKIEKFKIAMAGETGN